MRRNRIIWFCLWVASLVGISLKGGAVTYGAFTVLTFIPVAALLYLLSVYMLFHIYQKLGQRYVSVNEPVSYKFMLVNECPVQFVGIRVRFFSSFSSITDLDDETEYELKPGTKIEKETRLICRYRGEYEVGIKSIEIRDFLCLFRIRYRNKESVHAVVKPRLPVIDKIGDVDIASAVRDAAAGSTEPDVLSREYVPGDDRRLINWGQSARTGRLMTRVYTGSDQREIAVLTDTFRISPEQAVFLPVENKILELTLGISYYFCRSGVSTAWYHLKQELERVTAADANRFEEFYDHVADTSFNSAFDHRRLYEAVLKKGDVFGSSVLFFIASSWDADTDALLGELERNGVSVIVCLIAGDACEPPDLSGHKGSRLICVSPYRDLTKGVG